MLRIVLAVVAVAAFSLAHAKDKEKKETERACVTVTRMYFAQLHETMEECEATIRAIKAERKRCKKHLNRAKIDFGQFATLERRCSERMLSMTQSAR